MFALFGLGKVERARLEHAAALPRFGFQLVIECHRIVLEARDVRAVVQTVNVGGSMPRRPAGQFGAFEQDNILPAVFCKVVEDRASDDAASDDDGLGMGAHGDSCLSRRCCRMSGQHVSRAGRKGIGDIHFADSDLVAETFNLPRRAMTILPPHPEGLAGAPSTHRCHGAGSGHGPIAQTGSVPDHRALERTPLPFRP